MTVVRPLVAAAAVVLISAASGAQDSTRAADQTDAARVFLDCDARGCDTEYFMEEIGFVNWVRDRANADVHLLVSTIQAGGGGSEYTIGFLGANRFAGAKDSLKYNSVPNEALDATRSGLARIIRLGLIRFAAGTSVAKNISITYAKPAATATAAVRDPWNFWTFSISGDAFGNGEKSYSSLSVFGSAEANRITEKWKTQLAFNNSYNRTRFELTTGNFYNVQRSMEGSALLGRSVTSHWTLGGWTSVGRSDYDNIALRAIVAPAVEYDIYPYAQATRRQLTFLYAAGPRYFRYQDTTLYDKLEESLLYQQFIVAVRARQRWGTSNVSLMAANYPARSEFYRLQVNGNLELQVVKGLSLRVGGYAARVNDQLSLQKGDLTDDERLVRQRSLATNYRYFFNLGLSYAFGSIYNTIVNPRLRSLGRF